ncbi:MAG: hypothetical protein D6725_10700 [Planctomycetota bacterium]|nr:MAG: hypothetical protein D6725_10700 [Planctomycetota bacterium]
MGSASGRKGEKILVNRAPVLTLWAAVVAQRLGFDEDEALTLGRALAGLNAQAKGQRLGIFKPHEKKPAEVRKIPAEQRIGIELMGRVIPAINTPDGIRALQKDRPIPPDSVRRYLQSKFGPHLDAVREAMWELAAAWPPKKLAQMAFHLYEQFRPEVPEGVRGWGAKGELDLARIRALKPTAGR